MKQQFAIFDFDGKSYPITQCRWNSWDGQLSMVVVEIPYDKAKSKLDFVFDVVNVADHEILLELTGNKKFTAKILLE